MMQHINLVLTGNPNSGKTSLFNTLTGLNQKVGNFPGVTVDKKTGSTRISGSLQARVTDLPGTYSIYPKSLDEKVAYNALFTDNPGEHADVIVVIADASNLQRSLFFTTQVLDLQQPTVVALTMMDTADKKGLGVNIDNLSRALSVPVVPINPRINKGIDKLKQAIEEVWKSQAMPKKTFFEFTDKDRDTLALINGELEEGKQQSNPYKVLHWLHNETAIDEGRSLTPAIQKIIKANEFRAKAVQSTEVLSRYAYIDSLLADKQHPVYEQSRSEERKLLTHRIDNVLLHPVWGTLFLFLIMFIVFQSVFWLASYPMDWIDAGFSAFGAWAGDLLPDTWWADLLVNGVIAGLGGIVIFVPQIAILFFLITILEDTGYMARISFLMDKVFQRSGLSGKSVVPIMSGMACAIPAVMAARTIESRKQRIITILVTPFMSCTARLPVYAILISLIIPERYFLGFIGLQGLVLLGMYVLGFMMAMLVAKVLSMFLYKREQGFYLQELPVYQNPRWTNALSSMLGKARIFLLDAGKIIMIISVILWFLSSYGPGKRMDAVHEHYETIAAGQGGELTGEQEAAKSSSLLENSFAGIFGKAIEPAIAPLGYDWKIGIALLSSFAAREVFVGTMATIYSIGDTGDDDTPLKKKMQLSRRPDGSPVYSFATGISLMLFYAFAMQCMATLAIVKRETGGWRMALLQLVMMTGIAYVAALLAYQLLK